MRQQLQTILKHMIGSSLFFYLVIGGAIGCLLDVKTTNANWLNHVKSQVGGYLLEFSRGDATIDQETLEWGLRYYKKLLAFNSGAAPVYGNLGFCYYYLHDNVHAIEAYKKAISKDPQFYPYYWDMGMISLSSGDFENALYFHTQGLNLIPVTMHYYLNIQEMLRNKNRNDISDVPLLLIRQAYRDEEKSLEALSKIYFHLKKFEFMRKAALRGLMGHSKSINLNLYAGIANIMLKDYRGALPYLDRALELDPGNINADYYRSLCMTKSENDLRQDPDMAEVSLLQKTKLPTEKTPILDYRLHLNEELIMLWQALLKD